MPFDVSTADIEARWRDLSDDETAVATVRLGDAERKLRIKRPLLLAFYNGLAADTDPDSTPKQDLLDTIKAVLANTVIRFLRNPDVNQRQDIGADGSIGISFDTRSEGGIFISESDLEDIDDAVAAADGVIRARVRSQVLVSTFPWRRDSGDITILPTP